MDINKIPKIKGLLKKEYVFADFALDHINSKMKNYEKRYSMSWKKFIYEFEKGNLGDDRAFFRWYGLAKSAIDWHDTKKEIQDTLRNT